MPRLCFLAGPLLSAIAGLATAPATAQGESLWTHPGGSEPVIIKAGFELLDLNAVDEEAETFEFEGVLRLTWRDERLAFDPAELGADEKVYKGSFQFTELYDGWWPQVVLENQSGSMDRQGVLLRIEPDGTVWYVEEVDAVAETSLDLRRFPFDRQVLEARFKTLGYGAQDVRFEAAPELSGLLQFGRNEIGTSSWRVQSYSVESIEHDVVVAGSEGVATGSVLLAGIGVAREPGYFLRVVVAPLILLVMLSWSVFWMDRESLGERMDISFIGILTVVAFQIMTEETLPRISYFTIMSGFLAVNYLMLAASVVVNLYVGRLDRTGRSAIGDRVDRRCRWLFPLAYFGLNLVWIPIYWSSV